VADVHHHHHKSGGIGIAGMLLVLFVALKLTGHIGWSWVWVVSPVWIPLAALLAFFAAFALFAGVALAVGGVIDWRRARRRAKRQAARAREVA
jgi:energy-coupling factor transporter transmembrane protein EcfT